MEIASQIIISLFGALAIYLVGRNDHLRKWGFVAGLISQPFWFYTAYVNEQWGIFAMCIVYTWSWFSGFRSQFLKKN